MGEIRLFEDASYRTLLPIVYTRPVSSLRCGILLLQEKVAKRYPKASLSLFCRDYIAEVLKGRDSIGVNPTAVGKGNTLFLNGRLILQEVIPVEGSETIGVQDDQIVYARLSEENAKKLTPQTFLEGKLLQTLKGVGTKPVKATLVRYPWDLVQNNGPEIVRDFEFLVGKTGANHGKVYEGAYLLNSSQIYIGKGSKIKPCVVLDAESGPIYI